MFGTAAPFLGQGGIDPRMVSGPANAYMQQMQSLPIQGMMGGGGFQGGFGGGQGPQMGAIQSALQGMGGGQPGGQGQMDALRGALQGYQGGNAMPWGGAIGMGDPRQQGGMQGGQGDPRQMARMAGRVMPDGSIQGGGFQGGQWQPNGGNQFQGDAGRMGGQDPGVQYKQQPVNFGFQGQGMPNSGPGSMASYMPQPFQGGPQIGGDPTWQQPPQAMPSPPMMGAPPQQRQPFQPQGPGQRVTAEQLAARGLNPQEIQRKLQQFAGGQLGWQQQGDPRQPGGMPGGGQGGFEGPNNGMPNRGPDPNDPRVREFIQRMSGNPNGGQPTDQGVAQRVPRPRPGGGQPPNDMVMKPIPAPPMERRAPQPFRPGGFGAGRTRR